MISLGINYGQQKDVHKATTNSIKTTSFWKLITSFETAISMYILKKMWFCSYSHDNLDFVRITLAY